MKDQITADALELLLNQQALRAAVEEVSLWVKDLRRCMTTC
ncbi:hypothetical protein HBJ16_003775 [Pseudomonas sp. CES]|nr:hypothetical protein HBJ16_003775 [Pseudomonas sp. CES]